MVCLTTWARPRPGAFYGGVVAALTRAQVLAHRVRTQQLDRDAGAPSTTVLDIGVQDTGPDGARWALAIRGVDVAALPDDELVTAWTLRGAPHLYRRADLPAVAAAVQPFSDADAGKRIFDAAKPRCPWRVRLAGCCPVRSPTSRRPGHACSARTTCSCRHGTGRCCFPTVPGRRRCGRARSPGRRAARRGDRRHVATAEGGPGAHGAGRAVRRVPDALRVAIDVQAERLAAHRGLRLSQVDLRS